MAFVSLGFRNSRAKRVRYETQAIHTRYKTMRHYLLSLRHIGLMHVIRSHNLNQEVQAGQSGQVPRSLR